MAAKGEKAPEDGREGEVVRFERRGTTGGEGLKDTAVIKEGPLFLKIISRRTTTRQKQEQLRIFRW